MHVANVFSFSQFGLGSLEGPDGLLTEEPREGRMIDVNALRKYFAQGTSAAGPEFKIVYPKYVMSFEKIKVCFYKRMTAELQSRLLFIRLEILLRPVFSS